MTATIEPLTSEPKLRTYDAFFYGTLMHPIILKRVIHNEGLHLSICPAVLLEHTRHKVKRQDYPGVVPYSRGKTLFERDLEVEERCVRGTLVVGLTEADLSFLDMFEGSEYTRERVTVHRLGNIVPLASYTLQAADEGGRKESLLPLIAPPLPRIEELGSGEAETYIYVDGRNLEAELWSFEDFVRENAWKWYERDPDSVEAKRERTVIETRLGVGGYASDQNR